MRSKLFLAAILSLAISVPMWAQSSGSDQSQSGGTAPTTEREHHRMPSPDEQLQHMTKMLNLTPDQQAKIKPILEERQQKMTALMQDNSLSRENRHAKFQELRSSSSQQIRAILTPDQQKKLEEMRSQHDGKGRWNKKGESAAPEQK